MKKLWIPILGIGGAIGVIQTIVWEFARMRPDYQFFVTPWSMRGYETVHGQIYVALGVLALISFLLVRWTGSQKPANGALIVAFIVAGATALGALFGGDPVSITPGPPIIVTGGILLGVAVFRLSKPFLPAVIADSFVARSLDGFLTVAVVMWLLNLLIGGTEQDIPVWLAVLAPMALIGLFSLATEPRELAANRMLIYSTAVAAAVMAFSAGAVRSTLIRFQNEAGDVPASYRDTQVTSGHLLGVVFMFLVTAAAVMLWARRRDAIQNAQRANRQRAAAEASAAEIEEAKRRAAEMSTG